MWLSKLSFIPLGFAAVLAVGVAVRPMPEISLLDPEEAPRGQVQDAYAFVEGAEATSSPVAGSEPGGDLAGPPVPTTVVELAAGMERLLQAYCFTCVACAPLSHMLVGGPPPPFAESVIGFHPESCGAGVCSMHPSCSWQTASGAMLPDLLSGSLKAVDADELTALLAELPHRVQVNHDRRMLQLIGCQEQVVASYGVASVPALERVLQ